MKALIIDNGTAYLSSLVKLVGAFTPDVRSYHDMNPEDAAQYDFVVLSGGHTLSVVEHAQILEKETFLIRNSQVPILGICFGFELIADCFGARMSHLKSKEKSILSIEKLTDDPIFTGVDQIDVYESHRFVVTDPGHDLVPLARSRDGIEIIRHEHRLMYGFQFHPEMFPDRTQGDELFANFVKMVQNRGTV